MVAVILFLALILVLWVSNNVAQANTYVLGSNVTSTQGNSVLLGNASTDRAATTETQANIMVLTIPALPG